MSSSSGRAEFGRLDHELRETRRVLDTPAVGVGQAAELAELRRLVGKYPDASRTILAEQEGRGDGTDEVAQEQPER